VAVAVRHHDGDRELATNKADTGDCQLPAGVGPGDIAQLVRGAVEPERAGVDAVAAGVVAGVVAGAVVVERYAQARAELAGWLREGRLISRGRSPRPTLPSRSSGGEADNG
jgi:hypothetical protein